MLDLDAIEAYAKSGGDVELLAAVAELRAAQKLRALVEAYIAEHDAIKPWEWAVRFTDALAAGEAS